MAAEQSGQRRSFSDVWHRHSKIGKVALGLDLALLAFPLWILPSWYLITFLIGADGMFESPRAIAANSVFQGVVVIVVLVVNLVAIAVGKDHSRVLGLAVLLLIGILAYMGWYTSEFGFPGSAYR